MGKENKKLNEDKIRSLKENEIEKVSGGKISELISGIKFTVLCKSHHGQRTFRCEYGRSLVS